jgi:hypothetical protein
VPLGDVDDSETRFVLIPENTNVEADIRECAFVERNPGEYCLELKMTVCFPEEFAGVGIRDRITVPNELIHTDPKKYDAIRRRFKMFCRATDTLSADGNVCTARDTNDFVEQTVGFTITHNKSKTDDKVYMNVGFAYRAHDPSLYSGESTSPTVTGDWEPAG